MVKSHTMDQVNEKRFHWKSLKTCFLQQSFSLNTSQSYQNAWTKCPHKLKYLIINAFWHMQCIECECTITNQKWHQSSQKHHQLLCLQSFTDTHTHGLCTRSEHVSTKHINWAMHVPHACTNKQNFHKSQV